MRGWKTDGRGRARIDGNKGKEDERGEKIKAKRESLSKGTSRLCTESKRGGTWHHIMTELDIKVGWIPGIQTKL